jgi:peptidoglycan/xylan/chitin deacetylase (PgdA/CDA1 family)
VEREPLVLIYHGIVPPGEGLDYSVAGVLSDRDFDRQLAALRRRYQVLHPTEFLDLPVKERRRGGRRLALVTIDDGYQNLLDYALPVAQSHGITPLAFVCSGHMDGGDWLWFSRYTALQLSGHDGLEHFARELPGLSLDARQKWLDRLGAPVRSEGDALDRLLFDGCSSAGLAAAVAAGSVVVGGHSRHHPNLVAENPARRDAEILEDKAALEAAVHAPVRLFAYPEAILNSEVAAAVKSAGYERAFAASSPSRDFPAELEPFHVSRTGIFRGGLIPFRLKCWGLGASIQRFRHAN